MKCSLLILATLILSGCLDTGEFNPDKTKLCHASLNGIEWEGESFLYANPNKNDTMDIVINVFNKESILREKLLFFNIPINLGTYLLHETNVSNRYFVTGASYQTILDDGDVLGEQYYVNDNSNDNWVEINNISFDSDKLIIDGMFKVKLFIDSTRGKIFEESPDSIVFSNGVLKMRED
jgi:hypothetical protein